MTGWLEGKTVRVIGSDPALADALAKAGATIVTDDTADCLVHVARAEQTRLAHHLSYDEWRGAIAAGLDSRFEAAKAFNGAKRKAGSGGAILFIGSPEQQAGAEQAAAAGALGNLTKSLAVEWARDGVRVNTVLTNDGGPALGAMAAYLLSDYAAYVTGAVMGIGVDD
ncbi:MAG: SDR family oxidoreductase [Parasphingopyxis sp.]|uniref:SDR family oxidoreductase n=1 Tax=Parasphingopyxis sp. TaxID=1920299 RepID=UPI0032EADC32